MPTINVREAVRDSISFAKGELGNGWNELKPYAEHEFKQFAENIQFIVELKLSGQIDDEELGARLSFQKQSLQNVLIAIRGIGLITAQNLVNGLIGILRTAVEGAIGFTLPG